MNTFRNLNVFFSALEKKFANSFWGFVLVSSVLGFSRNIWSVLREGIEAKWT